MCFHPLLHFRERRLPFCPLGHFFFLPCPPPERQDFVSLFIFFVLTIFPKPFSIYSLHSPSTYALMAPLLKKNPYPSIHPWPDFSPLSCSQTLCNSGIFYPPSSPSISFLPTFKVPEGGTVPLKSSTFFSQSSLLVFCPHCHPLLAGTPTLTSKTIFSPCVSHYQFSLPVSVSLWASKSGQRSRHPVLSPGVLIRRLPLGPGSPCHRFQSECPVMPTTHLPVIQGRPSHLSRASLQTRSPSHPQLPLGDFLPQLSSLLHGLRGLFFHPLHLVLLHACILHPCVSTVSLHGSPPLGRKPVHPVTSAVALD